MSLAKGRTRKLETPVSDEAKVMRETNPKLDAPDLTAARDGRCEPVLPTCGWTNTCTSWKVFYSNSFRGQSLAAFGAKRFYKPKPDHQLD